MTCRALKGDVVHHSFSIHSHFRSSGCRRWFMEPRVSSNEWIKWIEKEGCGWMCKPWFPFRLYLYHTSDTFILIRHCSLISLLLLQKEREDRGREIGWKWMENELVVEMWIVTLSCLSTLYFDYMFSTHSIQGRKRCQIFEYSSDEYTIMCLEDTILDKECKFSFLSQQLLQPPVKGESMEKGNEELQRGREGVDCTKNSATFSLSVSSLLLFIHALSDRLTEILDQL